MASTDPNRILFLFNRMCEPVFMPKGSNNVVFDVPVDSLPERYRPFAEEFSNRFYDGTESKISVNKCTEPDMTVPLKLGRYETFSLFHPKHRDIAGSLITIFMNIRSYDDLVTIAVCWRDRLNPYLFVYALSVALLHRGDSKNIRLPPLIEIFPAKYLDRGVFLKAKEEVNIIPVGSRVPIPMPLRYTGAEYDPEHRLSYWREDVGINLHHWHWHLVYPSEGPINIVNKDRRGELFYYMHHQMLARYNCERFCNNLGRPKRLNNFREIITEGYYPKLDAPLASRPWPGRPSGLQLKDVNRPTDQLHLDLEDLERWRDRIYMAIHSGRVTNELGEIVFLTEHGGIDVLGNIIESSILTPSKNFYGDLHNQGHNAISYIHDPEGHYMESFGVMGDPATAMRDPIFYRWHMYIDDIFQEHKATLPEYGVERLNYPGIEVTECQIISANSDWPNLLMTFWSESDINLAKGLDFQPKDDALVRVTHLNHTEFKYHINVMNHTELVKVGTVRIFIAPKKDENGLPFTFHVQRKMMIEMDKFTVTLHPGANIVMRDSDSSVTIPFERTFRNLDNNSTLSDEEKTGFDFCGCGWPQHMSLPKGKVEGYPMELFVMISNSKDDLIIQSPPVGCIAASSYCGLRDRKYPDARSMGYPFDRRPRKGVQTLAEFLTPNMATADIQIKFTDSVVPKTKKTA